MRGYDKLGQVGYFTSVILIFIGFALFGIFAIQNTTLTGEVITNIDLPEDCNDLEIQSVWDSIFWESSAGISIVKNNSVFDGKCVEYFASKHNANEFNDTFILYGYTEEFDGKNVSYVFAERINFTSIYWDGFLKNITNIENVTSLVPSLNNSFFETYSNLRTREINLTNSEEIFNETFKMNLSESWSKSVYLNNVSYEFSNVFSNSTYTSIRAGKISSNYSYALFTFVSNAIFEGECVEDITYSNWSECSSNIHNRTRINSSNCYEDISILEVKSCDFVCATNWSLGNWSTCVGGVQIRSVFDLNSCGIDIEKPEVNQSCSGTEGCVSDWICDSWEPFECPLGGEQERNCTDRNKCDLNALTKIESQSCLYKSNTNWIFVLIILVIVGLILGVILFLLNLAKKKEDEKSNGGVVVKKPPVKPPIVPMVSKPVLKIPLVKKVIRPVNKIYPSKPIQKFIVSPTITAPKLTVPKLPVKPVQKPIKQLVSKPVVLKSVQQPMPKSKVTGSANPVIKQLQQLASGTIVTKPVKKNIKK